jgi:protease I
MSKATVVMLVGPEYEDLEVWYPKLRLEAAGYNVPLVGIGDAEYRGKHGYPCPVDAHVTEFSTAELAGVFAPGGWAPDKIRRHPAALDVVRRVDREGGMVATICHGPWILISAGILKGRQLTSTVGIRDDVVNAGGQWIDAPVVVDGNLLSARVPNDLPAFGEAMVAWLTARSAGKMA